MDTCIGLLILDEKTIFSLALQFSTMVFLLNVAVIILDYLDSSFYDEFPIKFIELSIVKNYSEC